MPGLFVHLHGHIPSPALVSLGGLIGSDCCCTGSLVFAGRVPAAAIEHEIALCC